jgi:hypothetical protein
MKALRRNQESKLTRVADGQTCMIRLPGCLHDYGVVLAHYRLAGTCGTGLKPPDYQAAFGCAHCHKIVDSTHDESIRLVHAEGVMRTQIYFFAVGLLKF